MDILFIKLTNGYTIYQIIRIKYIHIIFIKKKKNLLKGKYALY